MRTIRFGIVGTGMIAHLHAKAVVATEAASLAVVYDAIPERTEAFAAEHETAAAPTLQDMLEREDLDAVIVATPSGARVSAAVAAARAGKHVLCEKPMEVTVERADRIISACDEAGVMLGCVFQSRTGRNVQRIHSAIQAGRFGKLVMADAQIKWFRTQAYYDSAAWRGTWALDGGGALMNQGIHTVDLLLHFAGQPASVSAWMDTLTHQDVEIEDTVVAAVRFANGALGTIAASTSCAPGFPRRIEISGERGSAAIEDDRLVRWSFVDQTEDDDRILAEGSEGEDLKGGSSDPGAVSFEGHRRQIANFADAIRTGRQPLVPGREGRRPVELICGIYESARSGQPVHFPSGEAQACEI
jgi:predicted dehydrogenase